MNSNTPERQAARLSLLALRAALRRPEEARSGHYLLLPSRLPLPENAAIDRLVNAAKPVGCVGFELVNCLAIACWPYSVDSQEAKAHSENAELTLRAFRTNYDTGPTSRFLLQAPDARLLLSWPDVTTWVTDYDLLFTSYAVDAPDAAALAAGVSAVIHIEPRHRESQIRGYDIPSSF